MGQLRFDQHRASDGMYIWSCRRGDSGVVGFGYSMAEAQREFEAIEEGIWPRAKERETEDQINEALLNDE
jgi:hypothetical protein